MAANVFPGPVMQRDYRGNRPRTALALQEWHLGSLPEVTLEPSLPIVDAHHHLFGSATDQHFYRPQDVAADVATGHNLIGTVWVEAYGDRWRTEGPPQLRSLGEVEAVVQDISEPMQTAHGTCQVGAGMISSVDLTLGDAVIEVLQAHEAAAKGRLRGVRHHAMHDEGKVGSYVKGSRAKLLSDPMFRRGAACLGRQGLSFEALVYHPQIDEVTDFADAFPTLPIILNHLGQIICVADFESRRDTVRAQWRQSMRELARRPNVFVKVGGMGMPMFGFAFEDGPEPAPSELLAKAWQPYIDFCVETFGSQRCMFESNAPVDKQSCTYSALWNAFKRTSQSLTSSERRDLFYRTACHAYQLPQLQLVGDSTPF